jgi:uncharacterized protein (UPF0332 family)
MKRELIGAARRRLAKTGRRTRYVDIRRSISDAYYALFHALAQTCADELIGGNKRSTDAWLRVYRAIEHKQAKNALQRATRIAGAEAELIAFASTFSRMQEHRHDADYNPRPPSFGREDALALIDEAERAIALLDTLDLFRKRSLATEVLLKERA